MKLAQEIGIKMYCLEGINELCTEDSCTQDSCTQESAEKSSAVITLRLQPELFWFKGHFPGYSILPGVVQVNWVIEYFNRLFDTGLIFKSIDVVKFQKPLFPTNVIELKIDWNCSTQKLSFEYLFNGERTGNGKITFGDPDHR